MNGSKVDFLLNVASGQQVKQYYEIHIDYLTKNELWRYAQIDNSHDVIVEHYTPLVKRARAKSENEIDAMIEWEKSHPEILQMYRKDWKGIDEARNAVNKLGHILKVDEGKVDVYADMPYYRGQR